MRLFLSKTLALLFIAIFAIPTTTHATNGYFLIGYGAISRAMGGVGTALGQDGLAAAANPAAMTDVKIRGAMRIDAGGELFVPYRSFIHDSATLESGFSPASDPFVGVNHESGANEFLIPSMGMIYKFNRKLTIGMAAIGNGANTRYDQQVPGKPWCLDGNTNNPGTGLPDTGSTGFNFNCLASRFAGVNLLQMQMLPSVAYKVNKNHSLGASLAIGVQSFRAYGLQAFGLAGLGYADGTNLTNRGNDWSYGAGIRAGWLGKFMKKKLSVGVNYASRVYMTEFDKYSDLFAEQGDFDIPEHYSIGLAYRPNDKLTIAADYQRINYSDIASVGNPGPNPADPSNFFPVGCQPEPGGGNTCMLGRDNGMGFGWNDANVYKIGVSYDYNKEWTLRAGFNYSAAPMDPEDILFNFLAPAVVEKHLTLGFGYKPSRNVEWNVNYMHAFENEVRGPTVLGPVGGLPVNGENGAGQMNINSLGVSFSYEM